MSLPYQDTHHIYYSYYITGYAFYFSFPIFSPAETQVSIYLLGIAGCKSFSGINGARFYLTFRYSYWGLARHHSGNGATHFTVYADTVKRLSHLIPPTHDSMLGNCERYGNTALPSDIITELSHADKQLNRLRLWIAILVSHAGFEPTFHGP